MKIKVRNAYDESINSVIYDNAVVVDSDNYKTFSIMINNKEVAVFSRENGMCYDRIMDEVISEDVKMDETETAAAVEIENENGETVGQEETDNKEVISDYEILKAAYTHILCIWGRELERKEKLNKDGKPSPIADFRIDKTQKQLDELHKRILRIENSK